MATNLSFKLKPALSILKPETQISQNNEHNLKAFVLRKARSSNTIGFVRKHHYHTYDMGFCIDGEWAEATEWL